MRSAYRASRNEPASVYEADVEYAPDPSVRHFGVVQQWFQKGQFGFVLADDSRRVFVHHSAILPECERGALKQGERVSCRIIAAPKGWRACDVRVEP